PRINGERTGQARIDERRGFGLTVRLRKQHRERHGRRLRARYRRERRAIRALSVRELILALQRLTAKVVREIDEVLVASDRLDVSEEFQRVVNAVHAQAEVAEPERGLGANRVVFRHLIERSNRVGRLRDRAAWTPEVFPPRMEVSRDGLRE